MNSIGESCYPVACFLRDPVKCSIVNYCST